MEPNDHEASVKTILVAHDDRAVLDLVSGALAKGAIQVPVSDFEMRAMPGIARTMTPDRHKLKVLLTSGFRQGLLVLNGGWHSPAKPSTASQIGALVETPANPEKASRFSGELEQLEPGEVKPPRLSPAVTRYQA
jgi:hypothetical protein